MEVLDLAMLKAKTEERKIAGDECAKKRQELKELQELKLMAPDDEEKAMYDELIKAAAQLAPARSACGGARARATSSSARRTGCVARPPLSPWKEARSQRRPAASSTDTATTGARAAPGARAALLRSSRSNCGSKAFLCRIDSAPSLRFDRVGSSVASVVPVSVAKSRARARNARARRRRRARRRAAARGGTRG